MKIQKIPHGVIYVFLLIALAFLVVSVIIGDWKWFIRAVIVAIASLFMIYLNKGKK